MKQFKRRIERANKMMIAVAFVFALSWLPFHLFNIIVDFINPFTDDANSLLIIYSFYACCHILGMSSACSNPILYGWLNDKFYREFLNIYNDMFGLGKTSSNSARNSSMRIEMKLIKKDRTRCISSKLFNFLRETSSQEVPQSPGKIPKGCVAIDFPIPTSRGIESETVVFSSERLQDAHNANLKNIKCTSV